MSLQEVSAKVTKGDRANEVFTVKMDIPDTVGEAVTKFGEAIVYSRFQASLVIDAQSNMRRQIEKDGATAETVQEAMGSWVPGVKARGKTTGEKVSDLLAKLSDEERRELLADYL